jgi:putative CocE/NonD family hydrolase
LQKRQHPGSRHIKKNGFDYWLKGKGENNFSEANCFQTGSKVWKTYNSWPPKEAQIKKLYTHTNGSCSFDKPIANTGAISFVSDPAKPVPYRTQPIEATYGEGSRWYPWHVEDQRFVSSRPDVVSFVADSLQQNFTVTGNITAHIFVSTTGTDADFVVKLIDAYPNLIKKVFL